MNSKRLVINYSYRWCRLYRTKYDTSSPGLFGVNSLYREEDFQTISITAINKIKKLQDEIAKLEMISPKETLSKLDQISNELCSVIDVAEACRHVHEDPGLKRSSEEAFADLSNFISILNNDIMLHSSLCKIISSNNRILGLNSEDRIFAIDLKQEFESNGIHLSTALKSLCAELKEAIIDNEYKYTTNSMNTRIQYFIGPFKNDDFLSIRIFLSKYIQQPSTGDQTKSLVTSTDKSISYSLLRSISDARIRSQIWTMSHSEPQGNKYILIQLIQKRHILATSLGYKSHVDRVLERKILKNENQVNDFLISFSKGIRAKAEAEFEKLLAMKFEYEENEKGMVTGEKRYRNRENGLLAWDIAYYMEKYKVEHMSANSSDVKKAAGTGSVSRHITQYLQYDTVMNGLSYVLHSLFEIEVERLPLHPSESWLIYPNASSTSPPSPTSTSAPSAADNSSRIKPLSSYESSGAEATSEANDYFAGRGLFKYGLRGAGGDLLGIVYVDLYKRPGKLCNAAHFTIQCGHSNVSKVYIKKAEIGRLGALVTPVHFDCPTSKHPLFSGCPVLVPLIPTLGTVSRTVSFPPSTLESLGLTSTHLLAIMRDRHCL